MLLAVDWKTTVHTSLPHWCKYHIFANPSANSQALFQKQALSIATYDCNFLYYKGVLQRCLTISATLVAFPYLIALHTSLARVHVFSLMVTTHNSTALKANAMTEDIFVCNSCWSKKCLYLVIRHIKLWEGAFFVACDGPYKIFSPKYWHLKRIFHLEKDFVYNLQNAKVFLIWIKSHKGAV